MLQHRLRWLLLIILKEASDKLLLNMKEVEEKSSAFYF